MWYMYMCMSMCMHTEVLEKHKVPLDGRRRCGTRWVRRGWRWCAYIYPDLQGSRACRQLLVRSMLLALGVPLLLLLALVLWLLLALASQLYRVRRHLCLSPPATAAPD